MLKAFLRSLVCVVLLLGAGGAAFAQNTGKVGVVFMHGKWAPGTKPLENVRQQLMQAGYLVAMPMMPWSSQRLYDKSYEDAMAEIDQAVALLKTQGATRIVVGGQSLGANAAIGYGARRPGVMAIVAISPGHIPELSRDPQVSDSISRAKAMVAAGRGNDSDNFMDVNQGEKRMLRMTAAIYLSYWDPQGPAIIPQNAAKLTASILWVVGADDPMLPRGSAYAFDKVPANPLSRYMPVSGGHFTVVQSIGPQLVAWLNTVRDAK